MCCKLCSIKVIFSFSFWHDFSRHYTHLSKQGCATKRRNEFLEFRIVYNMQAEERLKPQRHLFNSKPGRQAFFLCGFARRIQITSPIDFFHSLCAFLHLFDADQFRDLHFSLILTNGDQKERLHCKAESSKCFDSLSHSTFYFITLGSPRHHSQTWGIMAPQNKCSKWLNTLFKAPHCKMWWCGIGILHDLPLKN